MPETTEAKAKRDEHGLWLPGVSGNPEGRPPLMPPTYQELARTLATKALTVLGDMMEKAEDWQQRGWAADRILDRAYGKPTESINHEVKGAIIIGAVSQSSEAWARQWGGIDQATGAALNGPVVMPTLAQHEAVDTLPPPTTIELDTSKAEVSQDDMAAILSGKL